MARHILVVFTNPVAGREEEFNRWYDDVHLAEVLALPGFVRAERFVASEAQLVKAGPWKYLAIYEIEADDPHQAMAALEAAAPDFVMSEAFDSRQVRSWTYTPC